MHNAWRNEQEAQQQLQQDEEEAQRQVLADHQSWAHRMNRSEAIVNNTSGHQLENYQNQLGAHSDHTHLPPLLPHAHLPQPQLCAPSPLDPPPQHHHIQGNLPIVPAAYHDPAQHNQHSRHCQIQGNFPIAQAVYHDPPQHFSLGPMNLECPNCHALHFDAEKLTTSTCNQLKFGMCCLTGQIQLPAFPPAPRVLRHLFDGTSPHSQNFKTNIWQYNAAFAFTSLGAKVDHTVTATAGPYAFRIGGELYHLSGALLPVPDEAPVFAQIYIHDPAEQLAQRQQNNINLDPVVIALI